MKKSIKQNSSKKKSRIKILMGFPHVWICIIIVLLLVFALIISMILEQRGLTYASSICANIFAGLLTGLTIVLLSGIKQLTVVKLTCKKNQLIHLRKMISDYRDYYGNLLKKSFNKYDGTEELFNYIYDVGSRANWINEDIMQSTFNRTLTFDPYEYCRKYYNYDAVSLSKDFQDLHENLQMVDIDAPSKKEIIRYFETVDGHINRLNISICRDLDELDIRLKEITTSIL